MKQREFSTQELILQAGKQEFLNKGFQKASLREIAKKAGVTTGAIYGYYADKEALFNALVEGPAAYVYQKFLASQLDFDQMDIANKTRIMDGYTKKAQGELFEYIYQYMDEFRLILCHAQGTKYENYVDSLVAIEEKYMNNYLLELQQEGYTAASAFGPVLVHILCSSCFHGLFEVITHNLPKEEGLKHVTIIADFYRSGWSVALGLS